MSREGESLLYPQSSGLIVTSLIGGAHCYHGNVHHNHKDPVGYVRLRSDSSELLHKVSSLHTISNAIQTTMYCNTTLTTRLNSRGSVLEVAVGLWDV